MLLPSTPPTPHLRFADTVCYKVRTVERRVRREALHRRIACPTIKRWALPVVCSPCLLLCPSVDTVCSSSAPLACCLRECIVRRAAHRTVPWIARQWGVCASDLLARGGATPPPPKGRNLWPVYCLLHYYTVYYKQTWFANCRQDLCFHCEARSAELYARHRVLHRTLGKQHELCAANLLAHGSGQVWRAVGTPLHQQTHPQTPRAPTGCWRALLRIHSGYGPGPSRNENKRRRE